MDTENSDFVHTGASYKTPLRQRIAGNELFRTRSAVFGNLRNVPYHLCGPLNHYATAVIDAVQ
jgi:hypothetical protein